MKKKYIVWWFIPFILALSIYWDFNSVDVMFPMTLYTGIMCFVLFIVGFVYYGLEEKKTKNKLESVIVNLCLFYTLFYPLIIVLVSVFEKINHIRFGRNWVTNFLKSNYSFKLFLFIQIIPIIILLLNAVRERKKSKK
jgi:magnesium-transporting ATPase (P-type)